MSLLLSMRAKPYGLVKLVLKNGLVLHQVLMIISIIILSNDHKENYGRWWDENCREAYEEKHP